MLKALLTPITIAIVGASRSPGKVGHEVVANLIKGGFEGTILPINPSAETICDLPCLPSVSAYEGKVDLSVICVPVKYAIAAIDDSLKAGVKALCVITAGFKEVGSEGARLERELAAHCRSHGARLLGPNCLGLLNTANNMNASFATQIPPAGGISVISQSGALCTAILDWATDRRVGLAKLLSMGNKADLDETDFLHALAVDPETRVITAYLESIGCGEKFIEAAEDATAIKPVVILKSGTTSAGAKAASSHTGSLAGADIAYDAAFKRCGIIRAKTFETLFDYATAFAMQPLPKGRRVAMITNAGGPGIMAADAVEHAGLIVAKLSNEHATSLKKALPAAASVGNPIDVLGDADADRYVLALKTALADDAVDAVIVILTPQAMTEPVKTAQGIAACATGDKPILVTFMGGDDVRKGREKLVSLQLPDYPAPERAVAALKAMCDYTESRQRPPRKVAHFQVERSRVKEIIAHHKEIGHLQLGERQAKEIMRAYNFTVPNGDLATDADSAVKVATAAGFPVVMKIVSRDIVHKSDVGGVKLNLTSPEDVRTAFKQMMSDIGSAMPEAKLDGVYIEKMCPKGREIILGMSRDPQFGPMLMFGLGGIFVEVLKDVTFHLAPITADEAMEMIKSIQSYPLLQGVRGEKPVDIPALAGCIQRLGQLVTDFPEIQELDINPLIAGELGSKPTVADARMTLK